MPKRKDGIISAYYLQHLISIIILFGLSSLNTTSAGKYELIIAEYDLKMLLNCELHTNTLLCSRIEDVVAATVQHALAVQRGIKKLAVKTLSRTLALFTVIITAWGGRKTGKHLHLKGL